MKTFRLLLFITMITYGLTSTAQTAAMITGTVRDHMGKPLNNATIGLLGTGFLTNSDKKGVFRLKDVPFGKYVFQASCDGYAGLEMQIEFTGNLHVVATLENRVINPA